MVHACHIYLSNCAHFVDLVFWELLTVVGFALCFSPVYVILSQPLNVLNFMMEIIYNFQQRISWLSHR
jgi:hypothetical protein